MAINVQKKLGKRKIKYQECITFGTPLQMVGWILFIISQGVIML